METSGTDLKVKRVRAGISQLDLAARMGRTRQTVARYEGLARVPVQVAEDYERALTTSTDVGFDVVDRVPA